MCMFPYVRCRRILMTYAYWKPLNKELIRFEESHSSNHMEILCADTYEYVLYIKEY
jgi:hypothetical protein